jgi:hypothetical protein
VPRSLGQSLDFSVLGDVRHDIFAFFIARIASAFIYANDTNPTRTATAPKPPVTAAAPAATTGSGGAADSR